MFNVSRRVSTEIHRKNPSRSLRLMLATAFLCGGLAGATNLRVSIVISSDGSPNYTKAGTDGQDGMDSGPNNNIVRTNDTVTYAWQIGNDAPDTNITIVSTLPLVNGNAYATWNAIPSECGAGSTRTDGNRTLTCVITGQKSNSAFSITPVATISGSTPNGTVLPAPTTTISSVESPTPTASSPDPLHPNTSVKVTAVPRYDLAKTLPGNVPGSNGQMNNGNVYAIRNVPGKDGTTPGTLIGFPIVISAMNNQLVATQGSISSTDEIKGLSPLQSPITFQDVLTAPGAVVYNLDGTWTKPIANTAGGCVLTNVITPGGMDYNNNGNCTVTQSGQTVGVTVTGLTTDSSVVGNSGLSTFTSTTVGGQPLNRLNVFQRMLLIWIPKTDASGNAISGIYQNTYTGFNPVSSVKNADDTTQTNVGPATPLTNGSQDTAATVDDSVYFSLSPSGTAGAYYGKTFNPAVNNNKGAAYTQTYGDGTTGQTRVSMGNNSQTVDLTGVIICEKFDNTTFIINPDASGKEVFGVPNATGGTGVLGTDYTVEYGTGGLNGVGTTWVRDAQNHSSDQAAANCADNQSPTWYTSVGAVPGGPAAVTKVRVKLNYPLRAAINTYYGIGNLNVVFNWKATGTPQIGPNKDVPYTQPVYMDNWAVVSANEVTPSVISGATPDSTGRYWSTTTSYTAPYNLPGGDEAWLVMAKTSVSKSIPKVVQPNGNVINNAAGQTVSAGSTATYQLSPALTLSNAVTTTTYPVTVTDTLPAGISYVPGSASIAPSSVTVNGDSTTTVVWKFASVKPNIPIAPITFDGVLSGTVADQSTLLNQVKITSTADQYSATSTTQNASASLVVSNPPGMYVTKEVLTPYVAPKGVAQYRLSWYTIGTGTTSNPQFIDILPYVGDGRGTTANPVGLASQPAAPSNDSSMIFYYTKAASSTIVADPNDTSNNLTSGALTSSGSTLWCQASVSVVAVTPTAGCPANLGEVTAVRGVSTLDPIESGKAYSTVINVNTSQSPSDGDLYTNSFTLRTKGLTYAPSSQKVTARVRLFSLSGTVYKDSNSSGTQDSGEVGLSDVQLTLSGYTFGPDGQDNNGSGDDQTFTPAATTTDASGNYTFSSLPPGKYTLTETQPANYTTTSNKAGTAGGTVSGEVISAIVLSRDATSAQATGYLFGELLSFQTPKLYKWVDNCGTNADLSGCPAVHTASDAIVTTPNTALPGDILRYTIIFNNANPIALANTIISDNIPANTTFIGATADVIPTSTGTPLISKETAAPYTWATCTGTSSTAITCTADGATHINVGWNTDGDTTGLSNSDKLPANTQFRLTFWVKVK